MVAVVAGTDAGRRVAVFVHTRRPEAVEAALRFIRGMGEHGIECVLPESDRDELAELGHDGIGLLALHGDRQGCELAVVLGGDGTILRAAEWAVMADLPLVGVNLGHVGFLAEAEWSEIDETVRQVSDRSWTVEERLAIHVEVADPDSGEVVWESFAVNEVSIEKAARERMLEMMVEIDGRPLSRWGCDGVLVSTPTGSTAYAFSAGGPVMWPQLEALLLVPLSAHALFARPLVLAPDSEVQIALVPGPLTHGVVWCDGRRSTTLDGGGQIRIRRSPHRLLIARLSQSPFTDRLVRKFGLRVEGWRGVGAQRLADRGEQR